MGYSLFMRSARAVGRVVIRTMDVALPAWLASWVWTPAVVACAAASTVVKAPKWRRCGPAEVLGMPRVREVFRAEVHRAWSRLAYVCRDRFDRARWRKWMQFRDAERLPRGPAVLAVIHQGPFDLLSWALAAQGRRAAMAVANPKAKSRRFREHKARYAAPPLLDASAPRELLRFLNGGGVLILAVDYPRGRLALVRRKGMVLRIATGASRLASAAGVPLIPCSAEARGWRTSAFVFGKAVPAEARDDEVRAAKRLARFFLPRIRGSVASCDVGGLKMLVGEVAAGGAPVHSGPETIRAR